MARISELVDEFKALDVAGDAAAPVLTKRKEDLARIKHQAPDQWEELLALFRVKGVPRLSQLEKYVDEAIRLGRKAAARAAASTPDKEGWLRDENGHIIPNTTNARTAFGKLGVWLSYDVFKGWAKIGGLGEGYGPNIDDQALNRLRYAMEEQFGLRMPAADFHAMVLDAAYQNRFHPVLEYLDGLKWDVVPRVDVWLRDYAHAKDTPYIRAVSAIPLVAAVRRVRKPGSDYQELLILESEQGHDKSGLIQALAVDNEWFSDSVRLNIDDKGMIESSSGVWIAEFAELQGMRTGDVERIKAQLSRRFDRARMAYAHFPTTVPRQLIGIGTVNGSKSDQYLADLTGNRRFWPVEVDRCDVAGLVAVRDQLWAEAAAREAAGESIKLPEKLWADAAEEQRQRVIPNALELQLRRKLNGLVGKIYASDAWELLGIGPERQRSNYRLFGAAWKAMGWTSHNLRRGGTQETAYASGDIKTARLIEVYRDFESGEMRVRYARS